MASRSVFEYPEMWARSGAGLRASCCAARGGRRLAPSAAEQAQRHGPASQLGDRNRNPSETIVESSIYTSYILRRGTACHVRKCTYRTVQYAHATTELCAVRK